MDMFRLVPMCSEEPRQITVLRGFLFLFRPTWSFGNQWYAVVFVAVFGALRRFSGGSSCTFLVLCALRLAPILFVRPGDLRQAERPPQVNQEKGEWRSSVRRKRAEEPVSSSHQAVWRCPSSVPRNANAAGLNTLNASTNVGFIGP